MRIQKIWFVFWLIVIWIWFLGNFGLIFYALLARYWFGCSYLLLLILPLGLNLFFSSLVLTGFVLTPRLRDPFTCWRVDSSSLYLFQLLYLAIIRFFPLQVSTPLRLCVVIGGLLVGAIRMALFLPHWRSLPIWRPYCILRFNWWIQVIVIAELAY